MGVAAAPRPVAKPIIFGAAVTEIDQAARNPQTVARVAAQHGWTARIVTASAVDPGRGLVTTVTVRCARRGERVWAAWRNGGFDCAWRVSGEGFERLGWRRGGETRRGVLDVIEGVGDAR